jgi:hypothetical protein
MQGSEDEQNIKSPFSPRFVRSRMERIALFALVRMRASPVAGHTADGGGHFAFTVFIILVEAKIFFVDPCGHPEHVTGGVLFRFVIAGKIEMTGGAVFAGCMAKAAFNSKGCLPGVHHLVQVIMADILWQNFQVSFWFVILWADGRHSYNHEDDQRTKHSYFLIMQHKEEFGPSI